MLGVEIRKAYLEGKKEKLPACKEQITALLELLETVIKRRTDTVVQGK